MSRLRAALVTPMSGPLSSYGRSTAVSLRLWAAAAELPRPWRGVELEVLDAHPDPLAAMRTAAVSDAHVLFGPYGSRPAVQVMATAERVVWNHGGATSELRWPEFPRVVNVLSPASSYFDGVLRVVRTAEPHDLRVLILRTGSGFARDVARGAAATAVSLEFEVSCIPFASVSAAQVAATLPDADVLLVAGSFEDELAAARSLLGRPWRAVAFVGAGVEEVLAPIGDAREGLLGPAQWVATAAIECDEGPNTSWFLARFREVCGSDPTYPAVQAFAAGLLFARCLRETGDIGDAAQLDIARRLRCRTLYGDFRLDPISGLQVGHEVLTLQWQGGRRRVVWPRKHAERALVYPRPTPNVPSGWPNRSGI